MYVLEFTEGFNEDIIKIKNSGDKALYKKLEKLIAELFTHPTSGTGKPEQLKHFSTPTWSRRLSAKHRLIYEIHEEKVVVLLLSAYGHYLDK